MFENKVVNSVVSVYFMAVAVLMHYFITQQIIIGVGITYRHLFALLLIFSAFVCFLIKPNIPRAVVSVKSSLVLSVPLLVVITASLLVWLIQKSDFDTISRGLSTSIFYTNWMSCALAGGVMLYIFGEKGIWYNLGAILVSNFIMIFQIISSKGVGVYMAQFVDLVVTFAEKTGDVIIEAEIHELAFCLGAYLIYMLLKPKKKLWFWAMLALLLFCFLSAFKRIAIIAVIIAVVTGALLNLLRKFSKEITYKAVLCIALIIVGILIMYIAAIRTGAFEWLELGGINTMGRADIYQKVKKYYEFSPMFIGNGIGFLTYQLNEVESLGMDAIHNDFLQLYIDLGFWGYILWILSMTTVRFKYFGRRGRTDSAIIACVLTLYLFIVSSTDNTINYPLVMTTIGLIIMGDNYDVQVEEQKRL